MYGCPRRMFSNPSMVTFTPHPQRTILAQRRATRCGALPLLSKTELMMVMILKIGVITGSHIKRKTLRMPLSIFLISLLSYRRLKANFADRMYLLLI